MGTAGDGGGRQAKTGTPEDAVARHPKIYFPPDTATHARAAPIYASSSFVFDSSAHGADLFALKETGNVYSRIGNPTVAVFEKRIAALEGGVAAVATASAQLLAITALAETGDNIVASAHLYGGTYTQLKVTFRRFGIATRFVTSLDPAAYAPLIDDRTRAIFVEIIANSNFSVPDVRALAELAHSHHIPLIVDNTFGMGGWLVRPLTLGADIVVASATKWIGGHGTTIGASLSMGVSGFACLSFLPAYPPLPHTSRLPHTHLSTLGKFDFNAASPSKFPTFTDPAEGYHGLVFSEAFGAESFAVRVRVEMLRSLGPAMNPFAAFLLLQGIETLSLRAARHCENAAALAHAPRQPPRRMGLVPRAPRAPSHQRALTTLRRGAFGGVLNFGVKGNATKASKVVDLLKLASNLANLGDAKTLVIHPASTTHGLLSEEEQRASGVEPDLIRVSVGIEDISDIIADFENALRIAFEFDV
ncbi:Cys/Met metabolism PLP-dependent enzyme-domain-containing protein [Mycena rebaudengoi]|nr:Cys/Met metabolism PLP-dependent enzyme-domain-containing protein [Mycena rebaudengoi]